jgi:para-nitrobenzyl esterase
MRAIPIGQRGRAGLAAAAAAAMLIAAAACTTATAGPSPSPRHGTGPPMVSTADGAVRGKAVAATDEFLGIPYAAPPVGALRWQPPRPPAPWPGIREATS